MQNELIDELKKCLDRYWRIMTLPLDQRVPFAAGITKLESRIEQLRAATGLDTDQFVSRVRTALDPLYYVLKDDEQAQLEGCLERASACFSKGDQPGAMATLADLEACAAQLMKSIMQEVMQL